MAGVLAPLQLQALGAGRRALERGRGRREGPRPRLQGWTRGAGADGVRRLDLYAASRGGKEIMITFVVVCFRYVQFTIS